MTCGHTLYMNRKCLIDCILPQRFWERLPDLYFTQAAIWTSRRICAETCGFEGISGRKETVTFYSAFPQLVNTETVKKTVNCLTLRYSVIQSLKTENMGAKKLVNQS